MADSSTSTPKKLYIKTFGCQMNVYDSTRMSDAMAADGYETVEQPEDADLVLLNTCHIREKAAEKVYSELGRLRPLREAKRAKGEEMIIGVAGCVAQAEGEEIAKRQPLVDLVVGPQAYHRLPEMTRSANEQAKAIAQTPPTKKRPKKRALVETDFPVEDKFESLPRPRLSGSPTAFLTVQEGCDKFCAFCVVPYTRGAEFSRPVSRILEEAKNLTDQGVREITLLGQNVNAYHGEGPDGKDWSLARLIHKLAEIDTLARIRFTTSHPNDMSDDLIAAHGEIEKLMPYLHLPVQAGSDKILKAMNRKHTAAEYLKLIDRIRAARPDLALSGDFIVGFPGETEADFQATLNLVESVRYASAYSFKYSPRPGTPAAGETQIEENEKSDRLTRLQTKLTEHSQAFQSTCIGKNMSVLLEKPGRKAGQLIGRSPYLQPVHLDPKGTEIGDLVSVNIISATATSLGGEIQ